MSDWFPEIESKLYDIHWDGVLSRDEAYFLARQVANYRLRLETDGKPIPVWEAERVLGLDDLREDLHQSDVKLSRQNSVTARDKEKLEEQKREIFRLSQRCRGLDQTLDRLRKAEIEGAIHERCNETIELLQEQLNSIEATLDRWKQSCVSARVERDLLQKKLDDRPDWIPRVTRDLLQQKLKQVTAERDALKKDVSEVVEQWTHCDWPKCDSGRYGGWRFCETHLKEARQVLKDDGYLQFAPRNITTRTTDQMENIWETKNGFDG